MPDNDTLDPDPAPWLPCEVMTMPYIETHESFVVALCVPVPAPRGLPMFTIEDDDEAQFWVDTDMYREELS
jgi:hypothetical protein